WTSKRSRLTTIVMRSSTHRRDDRGPRKTSGRIRGAHGPDSERDEKPRATHTRPTTSISQVALRSQRDFERHGRRRSRPASPAPGDALRSNVRTDPEADRSGPYGPVGSLG